MWQFLLAVSWGVFRLLFFTALVTVIDNHLTESPGGGIL